METGCLVPRSLCVCATPASCENGCVLVDVRVTPRMWLRSLNCWLQLTVQNTDRDPTGGGFTWLSGPREKEMVISLYPEPFYGISWPIKISYDNEQIVMNKLVHISENVLRGIATMRSSQLNILVESCLCFHSRCRFRKQVYYDKKIICSLFFLLCINVAFHIYNVVPVFKKGKRYHVFLISCIPLPSKSAYITHNAKGLPTIVCAYFNNSQCRLQSGNLNVFQTPHRQTLSHFCSDWKSLNRGGLEWHHLRQTSCSSLWRHSRLYTNIKFTYAVALPQTHKRT